MTDEEKTIEEQTEDILDMMETEDDVREALEPDDTPENPEEVQDEVHELREEIEILKEQIQELRGGGLRGIQTPSMIHKHLDNFLAALVGETPEDTNVRDSTEYWLKKLATGDGGSTKKIYEHRVRIYKSSPYRRVSMSIITNDDTQFTIASIPTYIKAIATAIEDNAVIPASGTYNNGSTTLVVAEIGYEYSGSRWYIAGADVTDWSNKVDYLATAADFENAFQLIVDNVISAN